MKDFFRLRRIICSTERHIIRFELDSDYHFFIRVIESCYVCNSMGN